MQNNGLSDLTLEWMMRKAREYGLKMDSQLISQPFFFSDLHEVIPKRTATKWGYRIATLWSVKFLSIYYVNDEDRPLIKRIASNGDYIRPIEDMKRVSPEASIRMRMDENYQPINCLQ